MKCHAHPDATAVRSCHACLQPLCKACSQDVLGSFFCSTCLTDRLAIGRSAPPPPLPRLKSPFLAGLLSLIPGLGQVYVGLVTRGIAHFVILIMLPQLADIGGPIEPIAILGFLVYYVWQITDAVGAARDVNRLGRLPDPEEAKALGRGPLPGADGGSRMLGFALAGAGALLLLKNFGFGSWLGGLLGALWPFALIGAGAWLLTKSRRERDEARRADRLDLEEEAR